MKARKAFFVLIAVLAVLVVGMALATKAMGRNLEALAAASINEVDLGKLPDGTYHGEYAVAPIGVKLDVHVAGGKITKIDLLEHRNGKGKPAEALLPAIVEQQRINVDSISGATYSSTALKKAVELALTR